MISYSNTLSLQQSSELKLLLQEKGFEFSEKQHAKWHSFGPGLSITLYNSGKLLIQGKGTEDFVLFALEPQIIKKAEFGYENILKPIQEEPYVPHIGIDESGKGDFFGPLVISAAFVSMETRDAIIKLGVKDSKEISSDSKLLSIAQNLRKTLGRCYSTVTIGNTAYNNLYSKIGNLNKLLAWGHARALENMLEKNIEVSFAISDQFGNKSLIENALMKKGKSIKLLQRTKAESDIAVASASILAREEFLKRLSTLSSKLGIRLPKGASQAVKTAAKEIIEKHGIEKLSEISKLHFKTYRDVTEPELLLEK
ncbi:MAG TPA: ribonuclease HIII [Lentisphaeria bacterium]|nr:MAG: ribonuclease HIII [Lentisphaerae bacterium GWF2_38_69]HBM14750.1 ribonuclease HIII [Lentisphaeria bacterium]